MCLLLLLLLLLLTDWSDLRLGRSQSETTAPWFPTSHGASSWKVGPHAIRLVVLIHVYLFTYKFAHVLLTLYVLLWKDVYHLTYLYQKLYILKQKQTIAKHKHGSWQKVFSGCGCPHAGAVVLEEYTSKHLRQTLENVLGDCDRRQALVQELISSSNRMQWV